MRQPNGHGMHAVHAATLCNEEGALRLILQADPTTCLQQTIEGETSVHIAAQHGHLSIIRLLLDSNADINAKRNDGCTPLHLASCLDSETLEQEYPGIGNIAWGGWQGRAPRWQFGQPTAQIHVDVLELLLTRGADVHAEDSKDRTPFYYAARAGRVEFAGPLLGHGARIEPQTGSLESILGVCAIWGHFGFAKLLLDIGQFGRPGEPAENPSNELCSAVVGAQPEMVDLLLDNGFDVESKDYNGNTPLLEVVNNCYIEVAKRLLRRGANLQAVDSRGRDALAMAKEKKETHARAKNRPRIPRRQFHRGVKLAPVVEPPWLAMVHILEREYFKTVLYTPFVRQSQHTSCWGESKDRKSCSNG
jgi:ankyrin repeat protein